MAGETFRLYDSSGAPSAGFNTAIRGWLEGSLRVKEHVRPKAFEELRVAYDLELDTLLQKGVCRWQAHGMLLSNLTKLMLGNDITGQLATRLAAENINPLGFRSALSQGLAKNTGENFINAIVYAVSDSLMDQDEVLVDKGLPPPLREWLTLKKTVVQRASGSRTLTASIEGDLCVFSRSAPHNAIIVSAKTRLKEVFHIGPMWKLLFDMIGDQYCLQKWGLVAKSSRPDMLYVFATADMIPPGGTRTQGPDVERREVRNLIALDASFFDYVFVSKQGISHVSPDLNLLGPREALFHELGCLLDLVRQKFAAIGFLPKTAPPALSR